MTVNEYLTKKLGLDVKNETKNMCFVIGEVINPESSTKYFAYRNTPLRSVYEWFSGNSDICKEDSDYVILNTKQNVVSYLSGVDWNPQINKGIYISLLVISKTELNKYYSKEQNENTIQFIDKKIEEAIINRTDPNLPNRVLGRVGMAYKK